MSLSAAVLLLCTVFVTTGCATWVMGTHMFWLARHERREIAQMLREAINGQ